MIEIHLHGKHVSCETAFAELPLQPLNIEERLRVIAEEQARHEAEAKRASVTVPKKKKRGSKEHG